MITLIRKVRFYKRIAALVDRYIDKHPDLYPEIDNTFTFNTIYLTILGLPSQSRSILFKKILIDLLARDNNILLDNKSRRFIQKNFTETDQEIIFYPQTRDISFLKYFELTTLDELITELITIFFYRAAPAYLNLWKEFFASSVQKEYISYLANEYGELIYFTAEKFLNQNFPSLT